jgi:replication factor A1
VNLLCRVITINPKEITVKGENKKIFYGIIGDESGTIPFTAWNELDVEKGDTIEVSNAYTREWQGTVQLNFGDRVSIEKTDKDKLPDSAFKPKEFKIKELRSGLVAIEVTAQVLELDKRETEVDGTKKKVFSGVIGDETS